MEDKPHDQLSRWSSETNYHPQYLVLKLDRPALVDSITFGKFEKTHICNLKRLKVFIGMTDACTIEVLEGELKNNNEPETFDIRTTVEGRRIPCQFIKLAPLLCWGLSFNLSIWYVELAGIQDPVLVAPHVARYQEYEESEVVKLCLKHFRQRGYMSAFSALAEETGVTLEDPIVSHLFRLVSTGQHQQTENFMERALADGQFRDYIQKQSYRPMWVPIGDSDGTRPGMRGGHQMCVDPVSQSVYLLGGWDGHQDMGDFWVYDVPNNKWTCLSTDTSQEGGPSPRSCHKMVLDHERRQLFVLGRYVDTQSRSIGSLHSDFYLYDMDLRTWMPIMEDTATMGGPQLLFDHQMVFDSQNRILYVFGGRILTPPFWPDDGSRSVNVSELRFSGLYSYHVATNTWTLLFEDCATPGITEGTPIIRSRVGHSMLFHSGVRKLYIYGGQRSKTELTDMLTYEVDSGVLATVTSPEESAPSSGFTQRATIDSDLNEIYLLSGLSKDKEKRDDKVEYSLWVYSISHNSWTCIHKNDNVGDGYWTKMQRSEPCPRFAHQFVYDHVNKVHYLFGGNPGRSYFPKLRLDDFWKLHLTQPSEKQLKQKFTFLIRKLRFEEMAIEDKMSALEYLQTAVYDVIDHDDEQQTKQLQALTCVLFDSYESGSSAASLRDALYNQLVDFFPPHMAPPKRNLTDVLTLDKEHLPICPQLQNTPNNAISRCLRF